MLDADFDLPAALIVLSVLSVLTVACAMAAHFSVCMVNGRLEHQVTCALSAPEPVAHYGLHTLSM